MNKILLMTLSLVSILSFGKDVVRIYTVENKGTPQNIPFSLQNMLGETITGYRNQVPIIDETGILGIKFHMGEMSGVPVSGIYLELKRASKDIVRKIEANSEVEKFVIYIKSQPKATISVNSLAYAAEPDGYVFIVLEHQGRKDDEIEKLAIELQNKLK